VGLSRCPECHLYFTRPRLARHNIRTREAVYEQVKEKYEPEARSGRFHKNDNYRYYLGLAESHLRRSGAVTPYRVLDIGSHCGFFVRYARELGWDAQGIEPAGPMVRFAREIHGLETIEQGLFDERSYQGESFHLITMFDVLEHIPDPVRLLSLARQRLAPGGLVLCKVPHIRFYVAWRRLVMALAKIGVLPRYPTYLAEPPAEANTSTVPPFFDLFEHVVHYDDAAVTGIFSRAGFSSTSTLPAPPTNARGDRLNIARAVTYGIARGAFRLGYRPDRLMHGLLILGFRDSTA
jgi:2-polyprenyl-3-methyl-5-hydroxy-6-metoxy-1,4-benzoquinol methylase